VKNKRLAFLLALLASFLLYLHVPLKQINKDLDPYYQEFMGLYNKHCPNRELPTKLEIRYQGLSGLVIGLCSRRYKSSVVSIDPLYWVTSSTLEQKQLMFHELTHCILYLGHVDLETRHYMAPQMEDITEEELVKQTEDIMKQVCGNQ